MRDRWSGAFEKNGVITLTGPVDKLGLFAPLFERAGTLQDAPRALNREDQRVIDNALEKMDVAES